MVDIIVDVVAITIVIVILVVVNISVIVCVVLSVRIYVIVCGVVDMLDAVSCVVFPRWIFNVVNSAHYINTASTY